MAKAKVNRRVSDSAARATAQRRRRNLLWSGGIATLVVAVIAAVATFGLPGLGVPDVIPGTSLANFDISLYQGERELGSDELDFAQLQGQPIVLNFWAGQCPPCRAEMPDLQRFYDEYRDDVLLLGVDVGRFSGLGSRRDAQNLLEELRITYPAGSTNQRSIMRDYQVLSMPTTVFIDSNGEVFRRWSGALNRDTLRQITDQMLAQEAAAAQ
jgi:thiol-disulfide isomerase/thioredoxin